jgi:hypothetical protein
MDPGHGPSCSNGPSCPNCGTTEETSGPKCWVSAEYLLWWIKNSPQPLPLVTTGTLTALPTGVVPPGQVPFNVGLPGTVNLYGPSKFDYGTFSGGRVNAGTWLDCDQNFGIEGRGFLLERKAADGALIRGEGSGVPFAVPFFNLFTGTEDSFNTASPLTGRAGTFAIGSSSRLWGAEINGLVGCGSVQGVRVTILTGFRYVDLSENENLQLERTSSVSVPFLGTLFPAGGIIGSQDVYHTRNQFYGANVGATASCSMGPVFGQLSARVGLGENFETVDVGGASFLLSGGSRLTAPGGLFAGPSKIGRFTQSEFSVLPEVEGKVGVRLCDHVMIAVGYNFLYWTHVLRPGDQVNRNVDPREIATSFSFVPGFVASPQAPSLQHSDFWAQGVNFSLEFRF